LWELYIPRREEGLTHRDRERDEEFGAFFGPSLVWFEAGSRMMWMLEPSIGTQVS